MALGCFLNSYSDMLPTILVISSGGDALAQNRAAFVHRKSSDDSIDKTVSQEGCPVDRKRK